MGSSPSDNNEQRLSQLFPGMDKHIIQSTLDEANGDAGRAIVLLIQTPSTSPSDRDCYDPSSHNPNDSASDSKKPQITHSKSKKVFIHEHLKNDVQCGIFWYYLSITYWIFSACLFVIAIIFSIVGIHFGSSITITICFCSGIELLFTFLILYGIIHFEIWAIWITFIWSGLHGITIIYSLIQYAEHLDHDHLMFIYIGIVLIYWMSVLIFNLMFFKKLKAAENVYHKLVEETKHALSLKKKEQTKKYQKQSKLIIDVGRKDRGSSRKGSRERVCTESKSARRSMRDKRNIRISTPMEKIYSASVHTDDGSEMNDQFIKSEDEHELEYETSVIVKDDDDDEDDDGDPEIHNDNNNDATPVISMHLSASLKITEAEIDNLIDNVDQLEYDVSNISEQP